MKTLTKYEISILMVALENYHSTLKHEGRNITHPIEINNLDRQLRKIKELIKKITFATFLNDAK